MVALGSTVGISVVEGLQLGSKESAEDGPEVEEWDGKLVGLAGLHQDKNNSNTVTVRYLLKSPNAFNLVYYLPDGLEVDPNVGIIVGDRVVGVSVGATVLGIMVGDRVVGVPVGVKVVGVDEGCIEGVSVWSPLGE
eukprot:scaffold42771_cov206-Amphora_coffeaeformis.AAC.2